MKFGVSKIGVCACRVSKFVVYKFGVSKSDLEIDVAFLAAGVIALKFSVKKCQRLSKIVKVVNNCQKLSKLSKNYQKWSNLSKIVKVVKNCQNRQKLSKC